MIDDKTKALFAELYKTLPEDGIQRTSKSETGKGYNTTGYGYQWIVDRMNEIFGLNWRLDWKILDTRQGKWSNGKEYYEMTVDATVSVVIDGKVYSHSMPGGNVGAMWADALKGAITNGLKKAVAMFGVGSDAFRGEIDEENQSGTGPDHGGQQGAPSKGSLDFNDVTAELKTMRPEKMRDYYDTLLIEFPRMTDPQKNAIDKIFKKAYEEATRPSSPEPVPQGQLANKVADMFGGTKV